MRLTRQSSPASSLCQFQGTTDLEFYSEQVREHYPLVLRLARRLVGSDDAEDVAQEALLKAFQHLRDYRHEAAFCTWLLRITWNEGMNFHRKRSVEVTGLDALPPAREHHHPHLWATLKETPEQICIARELEDVLDCSLRRVTSSYRKVWFLRELEHLNDAEIAQQLGLSVNTVKVRMHRARKQLRKFVSGILSRPEMLRHERAHVVHACQPGI